MNGASITFKLSNFLKYSYTQLKIWMVKYIFWTISENKWKYYQETRDSNNIKRFKMYVSPSCIQLYLIWGLCF